VSHLILSDQYVWSYVNVPPYAHSSIISSAGLARISVSHNRSAFGPRLAAGLGSSTSLPS